LANTKTIALALGGVALFGLLVCGGGGAFVYFKYFHSVPDVGPMAGQALALPADTSVVAGFDAKGFFGSAAYKQVSAGEVPALSQTLSPEDAARTRKEIKEGLEKALNEVEEKIGIRLDRDLDRVVVAGTNVGAATPDGALLAIGRFDRAKVMKAVEASTKAEGAVVTSKTVEGTEIRVFTEAGKPGMEAAFLDDSVLVVGTAGAVEAVVANHAKGARPLESNTALLGLVKGLDPTSSYWVALGQTLITQVQKQAGGAAPPVPLPHSLTLSGKFEGGLELAAEMADEAAAKNVVEMAEQGLSMVRMQAEQNPAVGKVKGAKEVLDGIKVTAEAKVVRLRVPGGAGGNASLGGALAAIAIPSLLRARVSANEAAAIGDVRTIISAEAAYSSTSGGTYGDLACLQEPKGCISGYAGPNFVDSSLGSGSDKSGYRRAFHPGAMTQGQKAYASYAYTATPVAQGQTGVRSFCGDATGWICFDPSGSEIVPQGGSCPRTCASLDGEAPPALLPPPTPAPRPNVTSSTPRPRPAPRAATANRPTAAPAAAPVVTSPPEPPAPPQPMRVGGEVREPRRLKAVKPTYPAIARQARVQGIVILECTISAQGRVADVRVLRSIPLLDQAAIDAVKQWEYEPTLLNGVPVPVIMTVTVNFTLK
jgi:TonB family protein